MIEYAYLLRRFLPVEVLASSLASAEDSRGLDDVLDI